MKSLSDQRGVTLVELITVIAIIAIVAGIVTLSSRDTIQNYKLKGAARQIFSDMQLARLRAIKEGRAYALEYSGTAYSVKDAGNDGTFGNSDDHVIKNEDIANGYSHVSLSSSLSRTVFYSNGTSSGGTVTLNNGIKSRQVSSSTSTGNIRIQ